MHELRCWTEYLARWCRHVEVLVSICFCRDIDAHHVPSVRCGLASAHRCRAGSGCCLMDMLCGKGGSTARLSGRCCVLRYVVG